MKLRPRERRSAGGLRIARPFPVRPQPSVIRPREKAGQEAEYAAWRAVYGGTLPEYRVFQALQAVGVEFVYQSPLLGGRLLFGGALTDFIVEGWLAIRVMGEYWHFGDVEIEAHDEAQRLQLVGMGLVVVDILAQDALNRPAAAVRAALRGEEIGGLL